MEINHQLELKTMIKVRAVFLAILVSGVLILFSSCEQPKEKIQQKKIVNHRASETLVNFKEALIFAFLGLLRLRGEVNCLSSVTGASRDHSSGTINKP